MTEAAAATEDPLSTTPSKPKKAKGAKMNGAAGTAKAAKPAAKSAKAEKAAKAAAKPAKAEKAAKAAPKPAKVAEDVSTTQPEDKVVLNAVKKLKEPTKASELASNLGVHRRVIRAQLQRLAKDKANGVQMKKDGFHWMVSPRA